MKIAQISASNYATKKNSNLNATKANAATTNSSSALNTKTYRPSFSSGTLQDLLADYALEYVSKEKKFLIQTAGFKVKSSLNKIFKTPEFNKLNVKTYFTEQKDRFSKSISVMDSIFDVFNFDVTYKRIHYAGVDIRRDLPDRLGLDGRVKDINFFEKIKDKPSPDELARRVIEDAVTSVRDSVKNEKDWLAHLYDIHEYQKGHYVPDHIKVIRDTTGLF